MIEEAERAAFVRHINATLAHIEGFTELDTESPTDLYDSIRDGHLLW